MFRSSLRKATAAGFVALAGLGTCVSATAATAIIAAPGFDIPDNDPLGGSSTITVVAGDTLRDPVPSGGAIAISVEVLLAIDHSFVGDLIYMLTSPNGTTITLADRPGAPVPDQFGDSSNLSVLYPIGFSDRSLYEAENMGAGCDGTDSIVRRDCIGAFNPDDALSLLSGINMLGDWTLSIADGAEGSTGAVQWWLIELDYTPVPVPAAAWLFGSALLGLAVVRRRRCRAVSAAWTDAWPIASSSSG